MTTQPLWRFSSFALGRRAARHSVASSLLLALIVAGLPALAGAQQTCRPDGDVDRNGSVTAADALLAFQQALSLAQLTACQQTIADVYPQPTAPDGNITASDALCIFQKALSIPSCLPDAPSYNQPPVADARVLVHCQPDNVRLERHAMWPFPGTASVIATGRRGFW